MTACSNNQAVDNVGGLSWVRSNKPVVFTACPKLGPPLRIECLYRAFLLTGPYGLRERFDELQDAKAYADDWYRVNTDFFKKLTNHLSEPNIVRPA